MPGIEFRPEETCGMIISTAFRISIMAMRHEKEWMNEELEHLQFRVGQLIDWYEKEL